LDWLRALWDMRTDDHGSCTNNPTGAHIMNWVDDTTWLGADNDERRLMTYNSLDAEANNQGTSLNTCFDQAKVTNGIDHPYVP
jgi:hypothetical protein